MVTPYSNRTDDELIRHVFGLESPDPLVVELAQRLESALDETDYWKEQAE